MMINAQWDTWGEHESLHACVKGYTGINSVFFICRQNMYLFLQEFGKMCRVRTAEILIIHRENRSLISEICLKNTHTRTHTYTHTYIYIYIYIYIYTHMYILIEINNESNINFLQNSLFKIHLKRNFFRSKLLFLFYLQWRIWQKV